jgi:hypothetical protein
VARTRITPGDSVVAGHFGLALGVKSRAPAVPTWALMLACQWLDVVFVPLLLLGVERLQPIPGAKLGAYGGAIIFADYTHSLLGAALLAGAFGVLGALLYGRRTGVVLGLVAVSHWLLDLPMHRADMPILPGNAGHLPRLGFGLWRSPAASAAVELAFVIGGAVLYWNAARRAAGASPALRRRANICGATALAAGLLTLGLNVLGR